MNSTYLLPIVGVLVEEKDPNIQDPQFTFSDFLLHLHASKDYSEIKLLIDSIGGYVDVADKIIAKLKTLQKPLYATNTGIVASAAVSIFLTAPRQNRTYNPAKGVFHPHNPWTNPEGDADYLSAVAKELKKTENKIVEDYSIATGVEPEIMAAFLQQDIDLTPEQVEQLGFATVIKPEFKAVAYFNNNNKKKMEVKQLEEKVNVLTKLIEGFRNMLPKAKCLLLQDAQGREIDFGADITEPSQIVVGVKATVNGAPATGNITIPQIGTLVCDETGTITEIIEPEGDEMEKLKKENESLKSEIEQMKAQALEAQNQVTQLNEAHANQLNQLNEEVKGFRTLFTKGGQMQAQTPSTQKEKTKGKLFI